MVSKKIIYIARIKILKSIFVFLKSFSLKPKNIVKKYNYSGYKYFWQVLFKFSKFLPGFFETLTVHLFFYTILLVK